MQQIYPALLSLLLPGLGQLYQSRYVPSLVFFSLFLLAQFVQPLRLAPLIPILACAEAIFRRSSFSPGTAPSSKNIFYAGVGLVGVVSWSFSYFPLIHPVGYQMEWNDRLPKIVGAVRECQKREGRLGIDFSRCVLPPLSSDPWGNPLVFGLHTEGGFEIRSAGPDQTIHTGDDFIYHAR